MKRNFCTECAQPLTKQSATEYTCTNGHKLWNEPVMTVAIVLCRDDKILASRRAKEPAKGMYDLPGGFCEFNESWQAAAQRELMEETSIDCRIEDLELIGAYTGLYTADESLCDLIVYVKRWQGEPQAFDDSAAMVWKPFSFIDDPSFNPNYPGLIPTLEKLAAARGQEPLFKAPA